MKRILMAVLAAALLMAVPAASQAGNILYWADGVAGTDYMAQALANLSGVHNVTTAADEADFEAKIAAGGWDLVILAIQNFSSHSVPNFEAYVAAGGSAIFQDWRRDATLGALFGVTYTGSTNWPDVSISDPAFAAGVTNPLALVNPGWGTYSMGMATTTGTVAATFFGAGAPSPAADDAAIVISPNGKGIINGFLTDTPSSAADGVQLYENEIGMLAVGKDVVLLTPNGGETLKKGSTFMVTWQTNTTDPVFTTELRYKCGSTWTTFALIGGNPGSYGWAIPRKFRGGSACKAQVRLRGIGGRKVASDRSDATFSIIQ